MTDAVSSIGAVSGGAPVRAVAAPAVVTANVADKTTKVQTQPLSPVVKPDAVSGALVTQYFKTDGQVETQFPSVAALAYLRQGLTKSGEKKDTATVA